MMNGIRNGAIGVVLLLMACTGETVPATELPIPTDSLALVSLTGLTPAISDTSEGGYLIAASGHHIAYAPLRFPGVVTVGVSAPGTDTIGGTAGEGPGEFRSIGALWYDADTLFVYDRGRSRVITYRGTEFIREVSLTSTPQSVVPAGSGRFAFTSGGRTYGGIEVAGGGTISFPPRAYERRGAGAIDRVAALGPDRLVVYDATAGALLFFDGEGRQAGDSRRLPEWLHERLSAEMRRRSPEGHNPDFLTFPEAKFLIPDGAGNIYLFYYLDDPRAGVAIRYSPSEDEWIRVGRPADSVSARMAANAFAGVIRGDTLHITRSDGIASFLLRP